MANRKKGDYSVLSEINTEEEWLNLLERKVSSIKISDVIRYAFEKEDKNMLIEKIQVKYSHTFTLILKTWY